MIRVVFTVRDNRYNGFTVSGHSGITRPGKDILCAAVSSAVEMAANTITEVLKVQATVRVEANRISLDLPSNTMNEAAIAVIEGLRLHLALLSGDYPGRIRMNKLGRKYQ